MLNIITNFSRYLIIILTAIYAVSCFTSVGKKQGSGRGGYVLQNIIMFVLHGILNLMIYMNNSEMKYIYFYVIQVIFFLITIILYGQIYKKSSRLLTNNMCLLLMIGITYITRLSYDYAVRQFAISVVAVVIAFIIPAIIKHAGMLRRLGVFYGLFGFLMICSVFVIGRTQYGATNWISIGPISLQPSELAKIVFVFFIAAMLYNNSELKRIFFVTIAACLHVLVLVAEKDLGSAVIFFIVYMVMLYVATKQIRYVGIGLGGIALASVAGYKLFGHVRIRVIAWLDPWSHYFKEGYQICQSLFAITTGGWFGLGFFKGVPSLIPIYISDFILPVIAEELGILFIICLLLIYICCFVMFINISLRFTDPFYKLVAIGLSVAYGFQLFLTVGGVIKFIPHTGVTMPLLSYGGSSVLSTIIIFAVIQGLYVLCQKKGVKEDES